MSEYKLKVDAIKKQYKPDERSKTEAHILNNLYNGEETQYRTVDKLYKAVQDAGEYIPRDRIKAWLNKQQSHQVKADYKGDNSFVADLPRQEYQLDLADMSYIVNLYNKGKSSSSKSKMKPMPRYMLTCVDIFSKKAAVEAVESKSPEDVREAFKKIITVLGIPETVMTDVGGEFQGVFQEYLKENLIQHIQTIRHAAFVERFNRTIKEEINNRIQSAVTKRDDLGEPMKPWIDYAQMGVKQYNSTRSTTTKFTPNKAADPDEEADVAPEVKINLELRARHNRKYPPVAVGDRVRVAQKPGKYGESKAHIPRWTEATYKVQEIHPPAPFHSGTSYTIEGKPKQYMRAELLKAYI